MIDWSKPVREKGSKKILRVLCTDAPSIYCVRAMDPNGVIMSYKKDGGCSAMYDDARDLENIPKTIWIPFHEPSGSYGVSFLQDDPGGRFSDKIRYIKFEEVQE